MRVPRELILLGAIFVSLACASLVVQPTTAERQESALSSHSGARGDALALYLWLQRLGYQVERLEYQDFAPRKTTAALFVLAPSQPPDSSELDLLRRWVEDGGTLIVAGSSFLPELERVPVAALRTGAGFGDVLARFGLHERRLSATQETVRPPQPLLREPPVAVVRAEATTYVEGGPEAVAYLGAPETPVGIGLAVGKGKVYALASKFAFSNAGLGEADNAALLLNWLPAPGAGGIAFDEIHHGLVTERSLAQLITQQPWGWATVYALAITFLYLVLSGRRFGRAVVDVEEGRRQAAEYVESLAGLLRRARQSDWAAAHYERVLRRHLGLRFGLEGSLDAGEIAARMSHLGPAGAPDGEEIASLAREMASRGAGLDEGRLVALAVRIDRATKSWKGRR